MPFTEEQKRRALVDNGYDPTLFDIDEQGYTIERQKAPPATAATEIQHTPPQTSAKGAFGRSFGAAIAPTLAGLATSAAALGAAETVTGVGAPVGIPTLALAGLLGAGASWAASKGQEKLMPKSWKEQLAADAEQHPIAANLGSLAPNLVAFRPNTPANLVKTVRGFIPGQIDDAARLAAKDAAINTGINLGVGAGMRTMEGGNALDPSGVAWDAAGALAFGRARNNALTRGLKLHPGIDEVNLAELVDAAHQDQRPAFEPVAPEAPAPTLRTWDFDIHGREKEIKAARSVVDKELAGRQVDPATYESMLVDASDKLRGEGKLKASNPVVYKLTSELKVRKEAEKIALEESKLEQERIVREEKLKKQFLSPEEAAVQNSALEQERIINEARARRKEELQREIDAENAQLEQEVATAAEDRRLRREQLKREVDADNAALAEEERIAREEAMRQRQVAQEAKLEQATKAEEQRLNAQPDEPVVGVQFKTALGSVYTAHEDGTTTRNKSYHKEHGAADVGVKPRSKATYYVAEDALRRLDLVQARGKKYRDTVADVGQNHVGVVLLDGPEKGKLYKDTWAPFKKTPEVGLYPVEVWEDGSTHFGNKIVEVRGAKEPAVNRIAPETPTLEPQRGKLRTTPEWMGRTSESRTEAPDVAVDQRRQDSREQALTKGFVDIFKNHFAPLHGDKLVAGEPKPGVKGFVKDGEATYTPAATQDTLPHELYGHSFIDKALADPRGKKIVGQLMTEIEASPDYARWRDEAVAGGKVDPSAKEYAAQLLGQRLAGDLAGPKYKTTETVKYQLNILKRELKRIFGRATQDDIAELVQNAYVMGSRMRPVVGGGVNESREDAPNVYDTEVYRTGKPVNKKTQQYYDYKRIEKPGFDRLVHFGTKEQAEAAGAFLHPGEERELYKGKIRSEGLIPLDEDVFKDNRYIDERLEAQLLDKEIVTEDELNDLRRSALKKEGQVEQSLINLLEKKGYKGFTYPNDAEGEGTSYALFPRRGSELVKGKDGSEYTREIGGSIFKLSDDSPYVKGIDPAKRYDATNPDPRYSRSDAPIVGSGLSRIRELGPGGEYLGDKLEANAQDQQLLNGRFRNPVSEVLREFSNEDAAKIDALVSQEGGFIPPKFKKAVATIKKALQDTHDEQRARGLPVKYLDEKGNTRVRPPEDKVGYNPSVTGTHVYDQLINTPESAEAAALRKDFIDYFTNEFSEASDPKAKAEERLQQMFPRKGGGVGVDYNAVRLAEGHGLPESWKEKNIANKWYRYLSKFNADLAYFKNLQSDPAVRQLLNINEDGKTVGVAERAETLPDGTDIKHVNYESNPHVIGALHDAVGGRQLLPSQMLSYAKLANAVTLGPVGKVRDLATVVPIAMELVGPWEVIKALPKAVMSTAEGIAKAKERGIINTRSATWHENLDNLDTMVDRAADTINHYTGAQKLEQVNRGFSWALGRTIAESMQNDPSFVKKFGGKKDVESLADRITENIQGTYDFRGTPTWIRESSFGPLFALNRWSIERFNNWKRNVFDEARDGNLKPLLGNMFGVLLGSALIDELNETIRGKKPDHLSWSEWLALDGEDSAYKLAAALSTSSTTGVLGDIIYSAQQLAAGKPPRGTGMPMLEIASNVSERLGQMVQAESLDFAQLAVQLAKDNIQIVRDLIPADPKADERRDVRIYKRVVEDKPTPFINANPFENATEKELRDATPEEFAALLPKVVQDIVKTSRNPAKDIESLKRSLSRGDNSFVEDNKFYQMLVKLRGEREAKDRLIKYLGEKALRETKSGALGGGEK